MKSLDQAPQPRVTTLGVWGPQILMGFAPPQSLDQFLKLHLYPIFWAIKVAYQSSDLED